MIKTIKGYSDNDDDDDDDDCGADDINDDNDGDGMIISKRSRRYHLKSKCRTTNKNKQKN